MQSIIKKPFWKKSFYCGSECYPYKCKVCKYIEFRQNAEAVAPSGSTIYRDDVIENFIKYILPEYQ